MDRLTTDHPVGNFQNCLNLFYAKDGEVWVRGGGPEPLYKDVRLHDYIRQTIKNTVDENRTYIDESSDEELGEGMLEWLTDGNSSVEGLIGTLYTAAWAFAELRARLKSYEDAEAEGRLVVLPCKVGDKVFAFEVDEYGTPVDYFSWILIGGNRSFAFLSPILNEIDNAMEICDEYYDRSMENDELPVAVVPWKQLYMTREEAEAALKRGKENA